MTSAELNRDVKRFVKRIKEKTIDPHSDEARKEFDRLHGADKSFQAFNADSLRAMIVLNRMYRYIPFHTFASYVEL